MKQYKVNLQVTGTIDEVEEEVKNAPVQQDLFTTDEQMSDKMWWYLRNNTNFPDDVLNLFNHHLAHTIIGKIEKAKRDREKALTDKEVQKSIQEKPQHNFNYENSEPLPWETKVKLREHMDKMCSVALCSKPATTRGMCNKHYQIAHKKKLKGGE